MIWRPEVLANFALRAGFQLDEAADAVTIALAATGGDDLYDRIVPGQDPYSLVGTWALDTRLAKPDHITDLLDVKVNVAFAYAIYVAALHDWSWHWAYHTPGWYVSLPVAILAVGKATADQPLDASYTAASAPAAATAMAIRHVDQHSQVTGIRGRIATIF